MVALVKLGCVYVQCLSLWSIWD